MTILEFLEDRLTGDEAAAATLSGLQVLGIDQRITDYLTRFDPERMLAECRAKRDLIHQITGTEAATFHGRGDPSPIAPPYIPRERGERLLLAIARIYAAHPDFDPAWADHA